jgi:hypothetical protein
VPNGASPVIKNVIEKVPLVDDVFENGEIVE